MKTCLVWGSTCRTVIDESRKIVDDRDGGLVLAEWRVAEVSLVDRTRTGAACLGKSCLPILAREYRRGAGDRHDEVRASRRSAKMDRM